MARLVLEVLDVGVQRAQLVALARARLALLRQLPLLPAPGGLLLPDPRALLAHLLPRLQHPHLQPRALALRLLRAKYTAITSCAMHQMFLPVPGAHRTLVQGPNNPLNKRLA